MSAMEGTVVIEATKQGCGVEPGPRGEANVVDAGNGEPVLGPRAAEGVVSTVPGANGRSGGGTALQVPDMRAGVGVAVKETR